MIADHLHERHAAQLGQNILPGPTGDNNAWVQFGETMQECARSGPHSSVIGPFDNARQRAVKVESAQGSLLSQAGHHRQ
jgi:hypothetical protein